MFFAAYSIYFFTCFPMSDIHGSVYSSYPARRSSQQRSGCIRHFLPKACIAFLNDLLDARHQLCHATGRFKDTRAWRRLFTGMELSQSLLNPPQNASRNNLGQWLTFFIHHVTSPTPSHPQQEQYVCQPRTIQFLCPSTNYFQLVGEDVYVVFYVSSSDLMRRNMKLVNEGRSLEEAENPRYEELTRSFMQEKKREKWATWELCCQMRCSMIALVQWIPPVWRKAQRWKNNVPWATPLPYWVRRSW